MIEVALAVLSVVLVAVLCRFVAAEAENGVQRLSGAITSAAARRLPRHHVKRYEAEWHGELYSLRGRPLSQLLFAIRAAARVPAVGRTLANSGEPSRAGEEMFGARFVLDPDAAREIVRAIVEKTRSTHATWSEILAETRAGLDSLDSETSTRLAAAGQQLTGIVGAARAAGSSAERAIILSALVESSRGEWLEPVSDECLEELWLASDSSSLAGQRLQVELQRIVEAEVTVARTRCRAPEEDLRRIGRRAISRGMYEWSPSNVDDLETHLRLSARVAMSVEAVRWIG